MNDDRPLLVNVIVPQASFGGIDLVAITLGNPLSVILAEALGRVLTEPAYEVYDPESGKAHDIFTCAIPAGLGVGIPLGKYGDLALFNEQGALALAVPASVTGLARNALQGLIAQGRAQYVGMRPAPNGVPGSVGMFLVTPAPGTEWTLAMFGLKIGFLFP